MAHRRARLIDRVVTNEGGARVRILERAEESARVDPLAAKAAERRLRSEVAANATSAKFMDYGGRPPAEARAVNEPHATRVMRQKMARERRRRSMAYADGLGTAAMDATAYPSRPPTTEEDDEEEDEEEEDDERDGTSASDPSEVAPPLSKPDARARRARERLARRLGVCVDASADSYESEWRFPEYDRGAPGRRGRRGR